MIRAIKLHVWPAFTLGVNEKGQFILVPTYLMETPVVLPGFIAFMLYENRHQLKNENITNFYLEFASVLNKLHESDKIDMAELHAMVTDRLKWTKGT